jgi:hypothetical protein
MLAWISARLRARRRARTLRRWERRGRPLPMPGPAKRDVLRALAARHGTRVFVETGTHRGDTVFDLRPFFDRLVTIELEPAKAAAARHRFLGNAKVEVLEGDSALVLPGVVRSLAQPALFWLDGHYMGPGSGDALHHTPISTEIEAVLSHPVRGHVIAIDDARLFVGTDGYPRLADLERSIRAQRPDLRWSVDGDIIRIEPAARA